MRSIKLLSPAKINLTLELLGLRTDGYHEIRSIIQPVSLFDEVSIDIEEGSGIELESSGISIPVGDDNLAWKAAELFLKESALESKIKIFIRKNIPLGTGLGGGSGNAAAVLIGLNRLTKALSEEKLFKIAPLIGADVAFFIRSQTAIMEGIGDRIKVLRDFPDFHYVILCPNIHTSTEQVYKKWDEINSDDQNINENYDETIKQFSDSKITLPLQNDLEKAAISIHPEIKSFKEILYALGLESVLMSGSGSSVFALFRSEDEALEIYDYLKTSPTFKVFLASTVKGWHRVI